MNRILHTEAEAFAALQAGEENGLHFFFDRYYTAMGFFAQSITHNKGQADEIASEAFVKLWQKAGSLSGAAKVKYYLYRTVHNACIDQLRRQKTGLRVEKEYDSQEAKWETGALHQMVETETHRRLYQLINQLPFKCRQVFQMFYFQDKAMKEIAEELGISVNTAKTHKQRALQLLKENSALLKCLWLLWVAQVLLV